MLAAEIAWGVACAFKAAVALAATYGIAVLLRRRSPAVRHHIWTVGVIAALLVPAACAMWPAQLAAVGGAPVIGPTLEGAAVLVRSSASGESHAWIGWIAIVWSAGALVFAVRFARDHVAAWRLVRAAAPGTEPAWRVALEQAREAIGLSASVELLHSTTISSPMTIGLRRQRVLLPDAAQAWSTERLRNVLMHELAHVKRRDTLVQLAAQIACSLYWFNPLAWLALARLRQEREHACDDLVLRAGIRPSSYASDLLDVARLLAGHRDARASAVCMIDAAGTEARIRRVLDGETARGAMRTRYRIAAVVVALAVLCVLAATSSRSGAAVSVGTMTMAPSVALSTAEGHVSADLTVPAFQRGSIDLVRVSAEVERRIGGLQRCYERRLAAVPSLGGRIVIHWTIMLDGHVPEQCITEDTVGDPELVDCVNELVRSEPFPAPHGAAVDVSFPFVFGASEKPLHTR